MSQNTLTSLAYLNLQLGRERDYFDYLRPFVLQAAVDNRRLPVTVQLVRAAISDGFGLELPVRTVELVLRRVARSHSFELANGVYRVPSTLTSPGLHGKISEAGRHIGAVLKGLREFSTSTPRPVLDDEDATQCVLAFLAKFSVTCLRAFLQGTAIPAVDDERYSRVVLVSDYVRHIEAADPGAFESFVVVVKGHMLANALLCPDHKGVVKNYGKVTFFLDTPFLVDLLGHQGDENRAAAAELFNLLLRLEGRVALFSHSRDELERVLLAAAEYVERPEGSGGIVFAARRSGMRRPDLLLRAERLDEELRGLGLKVVETPGPIEERQIDELGLEEIIRDEVLRYRNPNALEDDVKSVRSIFVLRAGRPAPSVERCRAVLVTTNGAFARAAWQYGGRFESAEDVSSVITDFSLANLAWLKTPMEAADIPATQVLAFSYAALEPSREFLESWLEEVDRLGEKGEISERDHQLLRSSPHVYPELMRLTLGRKKELSSAAVTGTLSHVVAQIRGEDAERLRSEINAREQAERELRNAKDWERFIKARIEGRCRRKARLWARVVSLLAGAVVMVGTVGPTLKWGGDWAGWIAGTVGVLLGLLTVGNLLFGATVVKLHQRVQEWLLGRLLRRAWASLGTELGEASRG